jgi:hypothetical protein
MRCCAYSHTETTERIHRALFDVFIRVILCERKINDQYVPLFLQHGGAYALLHVFAYGNHRTYIQARAAAAAAPSSSSIVEATPEQVR